MLAAIRMASLVMNQVGASLERRSSSAAIVERQARDMTRLLDDLLDISRVNSGKITLERDTFEYRERRQPGPAIGVPRNRRARPSGEHRPAAGTAIRGWRFDAPVPVHLQLADQCREVHAIATLDLPERQIGGRLRHDPRHGQRHRNRTGNLTRIFGLFGQVDDARPLARGRLGIGLALVRNLVEMHGGTVHASSPGLGRGSEFVVRLPQAAKDPV